MKTKSVIETDPAKVREICLNQPRVSQEEMVPSILDQNGKLPPSKPEKSYLNCPLPPPVESSVSYRPRITREQANAQVKAAQERGLVRPAWMIGSPECDWTEAADHENGQYFNKCVCCACDFIGHKRRHVCKRCHAVGEAYVAGMTAEERAEWEANRDAAISEYLRANSSEQAQAAINAVETT